MRSGSAASASRSRTGVTDSVHQLLAMAGCFHRTICTTAGSTTYTGIRNSIRRPRKGLIPGASTSIPNQACLRLHAGGCAAPARRRRPRRSSPAARFVVDGLADLLFREVHRSSMKGANSVRRLEGMTACSGLFRSGRCSRRRFRMGLIGSHVFRVTGRLNL